MKNGLDDLNNHLFEAIEMLKNSKDPQAEEHEKMDVETARAIATLAKGILEGYKLKVDVLRLLSKAENPEYVKSMVEPTGILKQLKNE